MVGRKHGRIAIDPDLPWEEDAFCRYVVACHPKGMTHAQIGQMLGGLSRERIRQIEARALGKLRRLAARDRSVYEILSAILNREQPRSMWEELRVAE
jgi:hypothetical protein